MSRRIGGILLAVALASSLLVACDKKSGPAASGVSTATPTSTTSAATAAPKSTASGSATAQAANPALEATLKKGLLQRDDVPGTQWVVRDAGMQELADIARSATATQGAQAGQDLITACYPNQSASTGTAPETVMRLFAIPPDGLTSVTSLVMKTADAQRSLKSARETRAEDLRACLLAGLQKSIVSQIPGATIEVVQLANITGLPATAGGLEASFRISASGFTIGQHFASISAAQGDLLSTTLVVVIAEGTTVPPLPAPPTQLGTVAAQRLAEALR